MYWRLGFVVVMLAAAACGGDDGDPIPQQPLLFDVLLLTDGQLVVLASDPARTACTQYAFTRTGCDNIHDVYSCQGGTLAPWITSASLQSGGTVLETLSPVDVWRGVGFRASTRAGHDHVVLVLAASDGQRAEIPIPDGVAPPQPTITDLTYDGTNLHVAWSATPAAASTSVRVTGGTVRHRCHVPAPQAAIDLTWNVHQPDSQVSIITYAAAPPIPTPLGEAMVWIGAGTSAPIPAAE